MGGVVCLNRAARVQATGRWATTRNVYIRNSDFLHGSQFSCKKQYSGNTHAHEAGRRQGLARFSKERGLLNEINLLPLDEQ
jgi:hypothetical protein